MFDFRLSNRRRSYRVYNPIHIICEKTDLQSQELKRKPAIAKDISLNGIYFEIDEALAVNSEIKLIFKLPQNDDPLQVRARVARIDSTEYPNLYGIGADFCDISLSAKAEIEKLTQRLHIGKLLELAISKGASDLHLLADRPPVLRTHGDIETIDMPKLTPEEITKMLYSIMSRQQIKIFEQDKELDFGIQYDLENRFRVNLHQQRGFLEATLRLINSRIPSFEELNLPPAIKDLARLKDGLILIIGSTGSGKTTTIAAMVDLINKERKGVIITLERPIEYVYLDAKSVIKQREIGIDTNSFSVALKSSLRQDPNVIVVGELDDIETVKTAIVAAEAGYLVIASFHAPNTIQGIDRLVGIFPPESRRVILSQIANCLKGVISQLLLPRKDRQGRVLASEVLVVNEAVKRVIRKDELVQLQTIIQTGLAYKMQSMAEAIKKYSDQDVIDPETALFYSEEFTRYARQ